MERPPLPAPIRFAIAFMAVNAAGVLAVVGSSASWFLEHVVDDPSLLPPVLGLAAGAAVAGGSCIGLLKRRPRAWFAAATLMAASAALLSVPLLQHALTHGLLSWQPGAWIFLGFCVNFLAALVLLLAGRRSYRELARAA
jgi:hypothetical protein